MTPLTVGLIGAGGISHAHAPSWAELGADVVVYAENGAELIEQLYAARRVDTLEELLAAVDVVDVCTPTPTHPELVRAALDAGLPVVCEKPLARSTAEAVALARTAKERDIPVFPGHVVRFFPEYVALRDAVAGGRIGDPAILRFSRISPAPTNAWFFDEDVSGGIVLDFMLHDLDQARLLGGEVVAVSAAQNPPTSDGVVPRILVAHVTMTHRSGAISHVQAVWGPPGVTFGTSFDVAGARGRLQYDSRSRAEVVSDVVEVAPGTGYLPALGAGNPFAVELAEFAAALDGGPPPRVDLADAVVAIGLAEAAIQALRTGETVPFDEASLLDQIGFPR